MIFKDRLHAGKQLAPLLEKYRNEPNAIVLGLPRGGVVTAYAIAQALHVPLDVTCPRKVGAPFNPELAIGAVTETGDGVFNEELISQLNVSNDYIARESEKEKQQAQQRLHLFRKDRPPLNLEDKTVILVDDGLATGATMKAAIKSVQAQEAARIVVAVPVSPPETLQEIESLVDEVVVLAAPAFFAAVGQFYEDFSPTEDEEVVDLLQKSEKIKS